MSDFDKEAEREKLRKKFEEEEEDRAATEQMSELLLKGATMTNAHCSNCGDPVFRYDGQEFCPTCQKSVSRGPADEDAETDADSQENIQMADPSEETRVQFGADGEAADESQQTADEPTPEPAQPVNEQAAESTTRQPSTQQPVDEPATEPTPQQPAPRQSTNDSSTRNAAPEGDVAGELAAAESLLAQTARRFAERASATDNPERAREHIAAAREAAEALDAVQY